MKKFFVSKNDIHSTLYLSELWKKQGKVYGRKVVHACLLNNLFFFGGKCN